MNFFKKILSFFNKKKPFLLDNVFEIDDQGNKWEYYSNGTQICRIFNYNGEHTHNRLCIPLCKNAKKSAMDNIKRIMDKPLIRNKKIDDILN